VFDIHVYDTRCLCSILGAKAHTSTDAIEVVANVTPVRLRIQELCTMEYVRLMQKPALSSLGQMLRNSVTSKSRFSPMSYLKYLATSFHRITGNAEIAPEHKPHVLDLFVDIKISELDVTSEARSDHTDCSEIASAVTQFISQNQSDTVICFIDGATAGSEVGAGCSAAIVILPLPENNELEVSELLDKITDSTETELTAIALAMETAIDHFNSSPVDAVKNLAILTDCKTALSIIMNSHEYGDYHLVIDRAS